MSEKKNTRHFHAGKQRKTLDGVEFVEVLESHGRVFVSEDGRVINSGHPGSFRGHLSMRGYYIIGIGHSMNTNVHRVIFEVFSDSELPDGIEVDHVNGDKTDNRFSNLRAVTRIENQHNPATRQRHIDAARRNSVKARPVAMKFWREHPELRKARTEKSIEKVAIPVVGKRVSDGSIVGPFRSISDAARFVGIKPCGIYDSIRGRQKTAGGCTWEEVSHV